jgi:hypothetical protein
MRKLSPKFMTDLKAGGILSPIREAVKNDKDLILEIREDYIDIYYRGGRILHVEYNGNEYIARFDIGYAKNHPKQMEVEKKLKNNKITTQDDANRWVDSIRFFKEIMDYFFNSKNNDKLEKNIQQLIVQENNLIRTSNSTDYFIVDFEYQCSFKYQSKEMVRTRPDLVGLFWDSKERKNPKSCKLAIIEVKYGDDSINNDKNGLTAHVIKAEKFLADKERVKNFKEEMTSIFEQKRELGLLNIKNPHEVPIEAIDEPIEFLFIIAGHNPRSSILENELDKLEKELDKTGSKLNKDNVLFATSSFAGYALFKKYLKSFSKFKELL